MACDPKKLINVVFWRKSIYDYTDKDHSNKLIQDWLWNEFSKVMETSDDLVLIYKILII